LCKKENLGLKLAEHAGTDPDEAEKEKVPFIKEGGGN